MKTSEEVEAVCKKLKPIIGTKADTLWHMYLAEDEIGRKDLILDIEILAEKFLKTETLSKQQILLIPPDEKESSGEFLLGDVLYNNKKLHSLYLRKEDFIKQVGIFAITGEGKTNLAYLQALQLLKSKTPFMVIDWKRSWRNLLSLKDKTPELKEVQVYTIGRDALPFFWNPFRSPPGVNRELWVSTIADVLEKSHLSGPGVAYYLNKIYPKLFKQLTSDFYPNFFDGLKEIKTMKAFERELRWKQTALRIFQSFTIGSAAKAFNSRSPVKLEELLDKPVIFELDLEIPKPLRIFFTEIILRWIHLYRLNQGEIDNLRHVLFLEEAHNLFSENSFNQESNSLENVYREIRAFGQGIVSITQHPSMLPVYVLGNCHTQIFMGLQHADDIRAARKSLFIKQDEESYPNMLQVGECIVKIKNRIEPCLVKTPLVPVAKGLINDEWLKTHNLSSKFWEYAWKGEQGKKNFLSLQKNISAILEGKKVEQLKNTPLESEENTQGYFQDQLKGNTLVSSPNTAKKIFKAGVNTGVNIDEEKRKYPKEIKPYHRLLIDIFENPFSTITERYKKLNLHTKFGNNCRKKLISENCILPKKIITSTGWITLFELTKKGQLVLRDLGYDFKFSSEGIIHKFWKDKIAEYYKKQNLKVLVEEYYINGRPDIIVMNKGKKVAVEIETGKSDFLKNINKALAAGFDEIICVATNKFIEKKIREELKSKKIKDVRVKVSCVVGF